MNASKRFVETRVARDHRLHVVRLSKGWLRVHLRVPRCFSKFATRSRREIRQVGEILGDWITRNERFNARANLSYKNGILYRYRAIDANIYEQKINVDRWKACTVEWTKERGYWKQRSAGRREAEVERRSFSCAETLVGRFCVVRGQRRSRLCTRHVLSPPYLSRNDKFASHCPVPGIASFSANPSKAPNQGVGWSKWLIVL